MPPSTRSRSTGTFDSFSRRGKPTVEISLKDEQLARISTYTSLDAIQGDVILTTDSDVRFDQLCITFVGTSHTVIERPGYAGPTIGQSSAFHTFLKLQQPIDETQYPQPRILEAGRRYTFPFTFVVPERLLPHACRHCVNHRLVHAAHTHLPPSLGDPMLAGRGSKLLDDMCPQMCQVQYQIRARLIRFEQADFAPKTIVDVGKKVRIIPATDEEPPLDVSGDSREFCMRKEKTVKKGALRKRTGRIAIAAAQPKAFRLPPVRSAISETTQPSTMVKLHIRFDPENELQAPPRLGSLWTKLRVNTFYSTAPSSDFPVKSSGIAWDLHQGVYSDSVCLASRCVASASWEKHTQSPSASPCDSRRSSINSTCTTASSFLPGPTACFAGKMYYTATVLVPISLPAHKTYMPTFHSCLTSRTYSLNICLSFNPPNVGPFTTHQTLSLRIPVQVTGAESLAEAVSRGEEANADLVDEFFTPRTLTPPPHEYVEQARFDRMIRPSDMVSAPPEYVPPPLLGRGFGSVAVA
ncbi:hypothetical protein LOZ54_002290 [Ophidiomyces ophidiicola]|nr:hypothetical protein LOZ54_002290 [Ophidiomyces ophidiicola]